MSERNGYPAGVPCWIDTWQPDAEAAVRFYTGLFGWEAVETTPPDSPIRHFVCRLRGRDVAAIGSKPGDGAPPAKWGTYVRVEDADATAAKATAAGGSIVLEPFDSLDGGRMAVLADPAGAVFGVWRPGAHAGAELVNEPGAWSWAQLHTGDPDRAKEFYGDVFGWSYDKFEMGDTAVTLWCVPGYEGGEPEQPVSRDVVAGMLPMSVPDDSPPHWSIDFWIDGVDAAADRAVALGGAVVVSPHSTPIARTAVLADPQGAVFWVSDVTAGE